MTCTVEWKLITFHLAGVSGGSWVSDTWAEVWSVCSSSKSAGLSRATSLYLRGNKCGWEIISHSVIRADSSCRCSVLFCFEKGEWIRTEGSYSTLTVSTSEVSAQSPINLQPYLLHNKFPREINSQVLWSVKAVKKSETSRFTNILQVITHKPWKTTILNSETA